MTVVAPYVSERTASAFLPTKRLKAECVYTHGACHRAAYAIKRITVAAKSAAATSAVASCVRVIGLLGQLIART
jgi:hypothetical protein